MLQFDFYDISKSLTPILIPGSNPSDVFFHNDQQRKILSELFD